MYSPQIFDEDFIKHELLSPTITKSPPSLISLLSSEPFDNRKSFQYSPSTVPDAPPSSQYLRQSQMSSDKIPNSFFGSSWTDGAESRDRM